MTKEKIQWIAGLKGICSIIVLLRHYMNAFLPALHTGLPEQGKIFIGGISFEKTVNETPLFLLINGGYMVYIFWIISAFLISYQYYSAKENDNMQQVMQKKAVKKYFSILGCIAIVYFIVFIMMKTGLFVNVKVSEIINNEWLLGFYGWNPTVIDLLKSIFIDTFLTANVPFDPVLWTMKIEFIGSILTILLLYLFGNCSYRKWIWGIGIIFVSCAFPLQYLCFFAGIILGEIYCKSKEHVIKHSKKSELLICILCMIALLFGSYPADFDPAGKLFSWIPVSINIKYCIWDTRTVIFIFSATLLIYTIIKSNFIQRVFANRVFLFLGKYSLEIYMLHFVVLCSFSSWLFVVLNSVIENYALKVTAVVFVSILFILFLSHVLQRVNMKYNRKLNKFLNREK